MQPAKKRGAPQAQCFFRVDSGPPTRSSPQVIRHNKQLVQHPIGNLLCIVDRSAIGLIKIYNMLPQEVVDQLTVKQFQTHLSKMLRNEVQSELPWPDLFNPRLSAI